MSDTRFRVGQGGRYFKEVRDFEQRHGALVVYGSPVHSLTQAETVPIKAVTEAK